MRCLVNLIAGCLLALLWATIAHAEKRVALVIGNSKYQHVSALPNPTNDADDISLALKKVGFEVSVAKDLGYREMRLALREFSNLALGSDIALVYYAGHGIEVDKNNYLVPIDAKLKKDIDVDLEALPLDTINKAISGARGLRLVLLDACRDNPFAASMTRTVASRSIGRGLARVEPNVGTLISYAAKEGTVAADGDGRNSPYTTAIIKHLEEQGLEIEFMFRKVRDSVLASTNGTQEPFTYGSLPGKRIVLNPGLASETPKTNENITQAPQTSPSIDQSVELTYWNSVKDSNDEAFFAAYLARFPNGIFSDVAKLKMRSIAEKAKIAAQQSQPPAKPQDQKPDNDAPDQVAILQPKTKRVHSRSRAVHIGDETIRQSPWVGLHGRCYRISLPNISRRGKVVLSYQGFGVEDAYAYLGNQTRRLPPQRTRRGKRRPNYWDRTRTLEFDNNNGDISGRRLSICAEPVRNPEKRGDRDDFMIRKIRVQVID